LLASASPSISWASSKAAPGLIKDGYTISQSSNFAGSVNTEVTANALHMRIGRLGLTIISKGPVWTAYVYNENNKNYVEVPKGQWDTRFSFARTNGLRVKEGKTPLESKKTGKTMTIAGFKASEVEVIREARPELGLPREVTTSIWIANDIIPPPSVSQLFCQHLNVPVQRGIPLRVFQKAKGKMVSILDTISIKRGTIPPGAFEPMTGYRKVKDEMQLIMDDSTEDMIGGSTLEKLGTPALEKLSTPAPSRH
jgi:hypothetical protein